ncbi:MAG: AzlD domain-containing protein [Clostridia bacterium]|nr:AzlD domain-containing protein [Clostridia bacterium]
MRDPYVYIVVIALVTYALRVLPLTLIRKPITSPFIRSFLYYVPYVTLAVMVFPAILTATGSVWAGAAAMAVAVALALSGRGLVTVAACACAAAFLTRLIV